MIKNLVIFIFIMLITLCQLHSEENIAQPSDLKKNVNSLSKTSYNKDNVTFSAQNIDYNLKDETVVATGKVTIISEDNKIVADSLFYNIKDDILYVKGNVVFTNKYNNKIYSNEAILDPKLNTGLIQHFKTVFADRSILKAATVNKTNESCYSLTYMDFTACSIVKNYKPTWELKAHKAIYNQKKGVIDLYSAWFEVKGIPILWTPYFSFSNLDFVRKIGFLTTSYESNSIYGESIIIPFYIPLGDHQDITFKTQAFLSSNSLYSLDYNGEIENGSFSSSFSFVDSQFNKSLIDEKSRWHAFFNMSKNLSSIWRTNIKVEETSDNNYLTMYDINIKDSKENFFTDRVQLEGFFNNNSYFDTYLAKYTTINPKFIIDTSGLNTNLDNTFYMNYSYWSDYSDFGRINFFINTENLFTKDQDTLSRAVSNLTYKYYLPTSYANYSFDALLQGVVYSDSLSQKKFVEDNSSSSFALATTVEYPLLYDIGGFVYSVSPIAQISYSKSLDKNKNSFFIDSYNVNVNSSNLFDLNHFQGYDQFDESKDLKYALKFSLLNDTNQGSRIFIGQMFKSDIKDNVLLDINNRVASNYFISTYVYPLENLYLSYNGIVDKNFKQVETSISAGYSNNLLSINSSFDEYTQLDSSLFGVNRISELNLNGSINIHKNIKINTTSTFDVSTSYDTKLKTINFNLILVNDCIELIIYNNKDYYSSQNASSWGFRVSIKSIDNYKIPI